MDIWHWLNEAYTDLARRGHTRLAEALNDLPSLVVDSEHEAVDALVAEALPLARASGNPWIEVFIRHWELQSRALIREQVKDCLPLAVELIDLSSRPETKDCPQSVCAVQDLASCYGTLDGPGYVDERVAVVRETLTRIDAGWPCFLCLSTELIDALLDGARPEDALEEVRKARAALLERDLRQRCPPLIRAKADALFALGRFEEAWTELEMWDEPASGSNGEMEIRLRKVRALAALGRLTEATNLLPEPESIAKTPSHYSAWVRAVETLVEARALRNDAELGAVLRGMRIAEEHNGARFLAFESSIVGAELALARGARALARLELAQAERLLQGLRAPLAARVKECVARLEAVRGELRTPDPAPVELGEDSPLEVLWESAAAAVDWRREVLSGQALDGVLNCLEQLGYLAEAEQVAERAARGASAQARLPATLRWVDLLSRRGDGARALELLDALGELGGEEFWLRARAQVDCLRSLGDDRRLATYLTELCSRPDVPPGAVLLLSELEQRVGNVERAFELTVRAAEALPRGEADWRIVELGTELGAWSQVRQAASRLGMPVEPGSEPIEADWGIILLTFSDDPKRQLVALRTGPVTARVLELSGPAAETEHGDDCVLFDPQPLEPPAQRAHQHEHGPDCGHDHEHSADCGHDHEHSADCEHEHDDEWVPNFAVRKVTRAGDLRSFQMDGLDPGDLVLREISTLLEGYGGRLEVRSPDDYQVRVPELLPELGFPAPSPGGHPGIFALFAVARDADLGAVQADLLRLCAERRALLVWPELCEAVGDPEILGHHIEIGDCLGVLVAD